MATARRGLNCTLSYSDGHAARVYRVRSTGLMHGFDLIATENEGRRYKAFYPRMTAPTQFAIQVALIGSAERNSFNAYLMRYADYILDPGNRERRTPQMTVTVPSRNFTRVGIPVSGIEYGTRLGAMSFSPVLVFETSGEPIDWNQRYHISKVYADRAYTRSPSSEFFYPTGTQLKGGEGPVSPATQENDSSNPVQSAVNGAASIFQEAWDWGAQVAEDAIGSDKPEDFD